MYVQEHITYRTQQLQLLANLVSRLVWNIVVVEHHSWEQLLVVLLPLSDLV